MASGEDLAEPGTSSPAASTSWVPQAALLDASEHPTCPVCRDASSSKACASSCRHCFCFACVGDWACSTDVCPNCWRPLRHRFPKLGAHNHERDDFTRCDSRGRSQRRFAARRWWCSSGRRHRSSYSGDRGSGCARAPERGRCRSLRWHHDGHRWGRHAWGYDSSKSRGWQQSRAWDAARDEGQALRPERGVLASSGRSEPCQRAGWDGSRHWRMRRSRSPHGSCTPADQPRWEHSWGHRSGQQWRSRDRDDPCAWESQQSRSPRRGQEIHMGHPGTVAYDSSARRKQWRSRDPDEVQAPRPERAVPPYSGKRKRRRRRGHGSSRRRRAARRRRRSRRRARRKGPVAHPTKKRNATLAPDQRGC